MFASIGTESKSQKGEVSPKRDSTNIEKSKKSPPTIAILKTANSLVTSSIVNTDCTSAPHLVKIREVKTKKRGLAPIGSAIHQGDS
jgi:hypothetical protein